MVIKEEFSYDNLLSHVKHVIQYVDDPRCSKEAKDALKAIEDFGDKYNRIANRLTYEFAESPWNNPDAKIVGYLTKDNRCCKYDRETQDFVVYDPKTKITITMHKKTPEQFDRILNRDYKDELPENK